MDNNLYGLEGNDTLSRVWMVRMYSYWEVGVQIIWRIDKVTMF